MDLTAPGPRGPVPAQPSESAAEVARLRSALRVAEQRLSDVQQAAGLCSWYTDLDGRNLQFSPAAWAVLGIDPQAGAIDAASIRHRVHGDDLPALRADRARVLQGQALVTSRFRFRRDDGRVCWLESRVSRMPPQADHPGGLVGTVRDVSELMNSRLDLERHRDKLEDLVVSRTVQLARVSERAEAAGRVRSAFVAHASHEVRTPLNVIVSLAHLLRRGETDAERLDRLQTIEQAAGRLGAVIDDLLDPMADDTGLAAQGVAALPAAGAVPSQQAEPAALQLRARHAGRRVLVAEDDPVNQAVMRELLAEVGLVVDIADDGQQSVEMVVQRLYALVVMDLSMPRLDGLGATRAMRAMPALAEVPIVAVTANAFPEDRAACSAAGMNDFLSKPIDVDRLNEMLLRWLDRSPVRALDPVPDAPLPPAPAPPPSAPQGLDARVAPLVGLEGVDALGGLGAVGGRVETYLRLLGVFITAHQSDGAALLQALRDDDAGSAGRVAHRLRGSAATLGLVDVETAAATLENDIDHGRDPTHLASVAAAVDQALASTVQQLRGALAH